MNEDFYYDIFVPEFALLQIEKEAWRCVARKDKVLGWHKINRKAYLWNVAPSILDEILVECRK